MIALCNKAKEILMKEGNILEVHTPVTVLLFVSREL